MLHYSQRAFFSACCTSGVGGEAAASAVSLRRPTPLAPLLATAPEDAALKAPATAAAAAAVGGCKASGEPA